ncbi:hypothetical protein ACROYT_G014506 [Oculina patagonica]
MVSHTSASHPIEVLRTCILFARFFPSKSSLENRMRLQSHLDCTPLVVIRYQLSHQMLTIIRSIMQSERCLQKLTKTYVQVALMGSSFDTEACSKLFLIQTMLGTTRMVVGNILTGNERDFIYDLEEAVDQACQAGNALNTQRCLLEENR